MFGTIVVGTDGSETAGEAVRQAVELAKVCGAKLHVVSAYKTIDMLGLPPQAVPANIHELLDPAGQAKQVLDDVVAKVRADGIDAEAHTVAGEAASALIGVAEQVKADCIVVGNRGMTGAARFLLGSVPNRVAHHAPCTVVIARTT